MALMEAVWPPRGGPRPRRGGGHAGDRRRRRRRSITIAPWDYRYYAEKVRKAKYDLDENEVKPYLQLEKLREGMFWVAGSSTASHFTQVTDGRARLPRRTCGSGEVKDAAGKRVGLWYFDPYARAGKHSGAWMNEYRAQERFGGEVTPIVSNNANFVQAASRASPSSSAGTTRVTLFHEFGHALHGLNSNVTYPSLAGTAVARDFVEFPSQLNEHWLSTPEVLDRFALHTQTGEPMPDGARGADQEGAARSTRASTRSSTSRRRSST